MYLASPPPASSTPGAPSLRLPEPRPRSPARLIPPPGVAYRPGSEPRASGCSIGPIGNWPILKPPNTTRACPVFGQGAGATHEIALVAEPAQQARTSV